MLQRGRRPDLSQETLSTEHRGHLDVQNLDRNLALVSDVLGEKHRGHLPRRSGADAVLVGEVRRETIEPVRDGAAQVGRIQGGHEGKLRSSLASRDYYGTIFGFTMNIS